MGTPYLNAERNLKRARYLRGLRVQQHEQDRTKTEDKLIYPHPTNPAKRYDLTHQLAHKDSKKG